MRRRWASWSLLMLSMAAANDGCREATQVEVRVLADVPCAEQKGVAWWVGPKGGGELAPHTDKQVWCRGSDVGAFVVVPSGEKDAAFDIRVVMGVGVDVEQCKGPDWKGCIVARRSARFRPHTLQTLRVDLKQDCVDRPCDPQSTCVSAKECKSSQVPTGGECDGEGEGCGEAQLPPSSVGPGPGSAGAGGAVMGGAGAGQGGGAGVGPEGPSCAGGLMCGAVSCCENRLVPGGTFPMGRWDASNGKFGGNEDASIGGWVDEVPQHQATVASFYLDTFEVTVGRFRQFVEAYPGSKPSADAGKHPLIGGSGWNSAWDGELASDSAGLKNSLLPDGGCTWTADASGGNENRPMSCVTWYEAFAFCAWDGGRLPTEAEWEYAAAGGEQNRLYPWGSAAPTKDHAVFNELYGNTNTPADLPTVGTASLGVGRWGHRDQSGGVGERTLDWYDSNWYGGSGSSCANCANVVGGQAHRVLRGGDFYGVASTLRAASRGSSPPSYRDDNDGFRCARTAQ